MTKRDRPRPLGELLDRYLDREGLAKRVDLAGAVDRWPEVVGPKVAAVTRAEAVSPDGILWVRVTSSAWATELSLMAPRILPRLNQNREGQVREIRCLVGPLPPKKE